MRPPISQAMYRTRTIAAAFVFSLLVCVLFFPPLQSPKQQGYPDSASYFAIASGHQAEAYYYYAGRVLHPLTARLASKVLGLSLARAFRAVSCVSLVILFVVVTAMVDEPTVIPLLCMAAAINAFQSYYIPDLFYAALTALFFLSFRVNAWLSLPVLFLLHLTRESTIILTIVAAVITFRTNRALAVAVVVVGLTGVSVTSALVARGLPSHHGISTPIFDLLKVGYNASSNLIGVVFWTDTNAATTGCNPAWSMAVHLGSIRRLGVCRYQWQRPLVTVVSLGSAFGILPLLCWRARAVAPRRSDLQIAVWQSLINVVMAPLIGGTVARYTLYAWPLFWLWGGDLLKTLTRQQRAWVIVLSLAASWIPGAVGPVAGLFSEAGLYWCGWEVLRRAPHVAAREAVQASDAVSAQALR